MEQRVARRMGRFAQLAVAASVLALADAGIGELEPERTGITVHTGAGGIIEGDRELLARADATRPASGRSTCRAVGQHGRGQRRHPARRDRAR